MYLLIKVKYIYTIEYNSFENWSSEIVVRLKEYMNNLDPYC